METGLQARIRELEDQLASQKAEADAARITTDNLLEEYERRFQAVYIDYSSLQQNHKQQTAEVEVLSKELCSLREQNKQLQSQTSGNSTALQEATAKTDSLAADNHKLHEALTLLRNSQNEKCEELANLLTANAELRRDKVTLETEKQAAADKAEHWQRQYEGQKKRYAQMEQAFQQNLDELQAARDEARQHSSQQKQEVQTLRLNLSALEADVARLTASEAMWKERSEKAIEQYKNYVTTIGAQEEVQAQSQSNMEQQLETAKASARVSQEQLAAANARMHELERLLAASKAAMDTAQANHEETLRAAQELAGKQAELAEARRKQVEQLSAGGASGGTPGQFIAFSPAVAGTPRTPAGAAGSPASASAAALVNQPPAQIAAVLHAQGRTYEDLVTMYADMADAFRNEHASRRHLERQLDALCQQVQRRMAQATAQQQEHEQLAQAHQSTLRDLEEAQGQVRLLQAQLRESAGKVSDVQREAAMMRQALKDKERQIALLTAEVERLQGRPVPDISGAAPPLAGGVLSGQDVISEGLITFGSIQELVSINTKLQIVARQVVAEAEKSKEEVAATYRQRWEAEQAALQAETERLRQLCSRLTAEVQQHRSNPHQSPGSGHRPATPAAAGSPDHSTGSAELQQQVDDLKAQLEDVQTQLETTHTDANNTIGMLREQLAEARTATAAARGEAAQVRRRCHGSRCSV
eukprot:GHUV01017061.1.p1 GENE.GHUV01017061.1~~GHUV01017061.1.p1  ORF type:complete len:702 (+),score=287.51 GHUV01017061.1:1505-3610(+)